MQLNVINAVQSNRKISLMQSKLLPKDIYGNNFVYYNDVKVDLLLQNVIDYCFSIDKC